jgi:predicted nucleic acid-binding protein
MKEGMHLCDHLDEFNKFLMDLKNIDIQVDNNDQALILLCSLPDLFDNFVNSMLYGRYTIYLADIKSVLNSMKLRTRLNGSHSIVLSSVQSNNFITHRKIEKSSNFISFESLPSTKGI